MSLRFAGSTKGARGSGFPWTYACDRRLMTPAANSSAGPWDPQHRPRLPSVPSSLRSSSNHKQSMREPSSAKSGLLHAFVAVACGIERGFELGNMLWPPRFHRDIDHRITQHDSVVRAVMERLDDVGLVIGNHGCESLQRARVVRQMNADSQ